MYEIRYDEQVIADELHDIDEVIEELDDQGLSWYSPGVSVWNTDRDEPLSAGFWGMLDQLRYAEGV